MAREEDSRIVKLAPGPNTQQGLCLQQPPNGWLIYAVRFVQGTCGSAIGDTLCNTMDIVNVQSPTWQSGQILDLSLQYFATPNGWQPVNYYHAINGCDNTSIDVNNRVQIRKL